VSEEGGYIAGTAINVDGRTFARGVMWLDCILGAWKRRIAKRC
jgi:hypothetical protein